MKYIISIILIFNISVVNANEIFNLLKIPNLEIYNTNSLNGLKYLYAESNFKIGLKKNISWNKLKKKESVLKSILAENEFVKSSNG